MVDYAETGASERIAMCGGCIRGVCERVCVVCVCGVCACVNTSPARLHRAL